MHLGHSLLVNNSHQALAQGYKQADRQVPIAAATCLSSVLQGYRQLQFLQCQQIDTDEANSLTVTAPVLAHVCTAGLQAVAVSGVSADTHR